MLPAKHFYMIRHGETEANKDRIMAGSLDSPLTSNGKKQAERVQTIVKSLEEKPKAIIHSNLSRARDTATIINQALNIPIHEEKDIAELHAGDWEGSTYKECAELLTGWPTPPNGESFTEFCSRIKRGKKRILNNHESPALIVSHGGVFRAFGGIYSLKTPGAFKNCHLYEFFPDTKNKKFPWKVWSYEIEGNNVKRRPNDIFHTSEFFKRS